jgi:hypothetical protein
VNLNLRRLTLGTLVIFITGMAAWPAYPAGLRCRSDPVVLLTDGTIIDLSADVDAALWDVSSVHYTVHVPCTAHVLAVVRTPNWPTTLETFNVVSDATQGRYDTSTVVHTKQTGVGVTASLVVKTLRNLISMASTSGRDRQPLRVMLYTL